MGHHKCLIYTRMIFYMCVICVHTINALVLLSSFSDEAMKTQGVRDFYETQYYFYTCWNFGFQTVYAAFALFCDWASLFDAEKKPALPKCISNLRETAFTVLVWPGTLMVITYFWGFYFYDRNLLYPEYFDQVVSSISNHILHTLILPIALTELVLYPRTKPESHVKRILAVLGLQTVYVFTIYYIHCTTGIWIYPIFGKLNKCPVGLLTFLGFTSVYLSILYYGQYCISSIVFNVREKIGQKYCSACRN